MGLTNGLTKANICCPEPVAQLKIHSCSALCSSECISLRSAKTRLCTLECSWQV